MVWEASAIPKLRLGTRGSKLALAQAHSVKALLEAAGHEVEIITIKTSGDKGDREKLGAFVREIQQALLDNEIDVALHCLKDLPTQGVVGLVYAAHLEREDARDALISRGPNVDVLPEGAVVGTGSVRRTSQLAALRPDLQFKPLLGNVDTRLRKLMDGEYDAIVLAIAGLKRLGVMDGWSESPYGSLSVHMLDMVPAPGQAVLVLETRFEDAPLVAFLNHSGTERCATAEREFLRAFGGGCSVPVAAYAQIVDGELVIDGLVATPDGQRVLRATKSSASELIETMRLEGAFEIVQSLVGNRGGVEH